MTITSSSRGTIASAYLCVALGLTACSDDGENGSGGSADGDAGESAEDASADASGSGSSASAEGDGSGGDDGDDGSGGSADDASTSAGDGTLFDVGADTDGDPEDCECGNSDYSYIWIANSAEHTVSKLNTRTMDEEGRYNTRPDTNGNPSRTSVSVDGRAVAIANRATGLTKIWARPDLCEDRNGNGTIDTSSGSADVLPFADEECIAWHNPFTTVDGVDMTVQRPVAWTSGVLNETTCEFEDQKVWTMTGALGTSPSQCGQSGVWVHLVDGETGDIDWTVEIPHAEAECNIPGVDWGFGPYGAAVDNDNNVWFYIWAQGRIVKVDYQTRAYQVFNGGSYGITVDTMGRVWVGDSPRRFDEATQTWQSSGLPGAGGSGIAQDLQGRIWAATQGGIGWVDMETLAVGDTVTLPDTNIFRGISVDIDGYVWAVPLGSTTAYRVHPETYDWEVYSGLNAPYTYSDMSGGQLNNVTCHEPAG